MAISRALLMSAALGSFAFPTLAAAQEEWTGVYGGFQAGYGWQAGDQSETIGFDTDLNGTYGDTVNTTSGANAFSPGFCSGDAKGPTPAAGCGEDSDYFEGGFHVGYDNQLADNFLVGAVFDYTRTGVRNSASAFSTTPASYTITRRMNDLVTLRARAGLVAGKSLIYLTGGLAYGRVKNSITTSNTVNSFTGNGNEDAWGFVVGGGVEHRLTPKVSVGVQFLYHNLDAGDYKVRVGQGTAPATNPFLLTNNAGTDMKRSSRNIEAESLRLSTSYRF